MHCGSAIYLFSLIEINYAGETVTVVGQFVQAPDAVVRVKTLGPRQLKLACAIDHAECDDGSRIVNIQFTPLLPRCMSAPPGLPHKSKNVCQKHVGDGPTKGRKKVVLTLVTQSVHVPFVTPEKVTFHVAGAPFGQF